MTTTNNTNIVPSSTNIFDFDWFERNFTQSSVNTNYSSYLFDDFSAKKLVENMPNNNYEVAHKLHRFISCLINKNIIVCLNDKDDSYTDGKSIMVSSLMEWKEPEVNYYGKIDAMLGLTLHESCHCLYTDFNCMKYNKVNRAEQWFLNVIEDETIENTLKNHYGGFTKFLETVKYYYFDEKFTGKFETKSDFDEICSIFLNIIRYPKFILCGLLTDEQKNKYGKLFLSIYYILKRNNCIIKQNGDISKKNFTSTKNNLLAVREIVKEIQNFLSIDEKEMEKQSKQQKQLDGSAMSGTGNGSKTELTDSPTDEQKELAKQLSEMVDEQESEFASDQEEDFERNLGSLNKTINNNINGNKQIYEKYYSWAYPHIEKTTKMIYNNSTKINYKTTRFNMTGQLDGACIGSAFIGNKFVCKQIKEEKKQQSAKMAVVLMCDMSGSMSDGNVLDRVGKYMTLLSEAVSNIDGCELYVYTHNESIKCLIANDYNKNKKNLGYLTKCNANCGQDEVNAYTSIIDDVRTKTKLPVCTINFTDSEYGRRPEKIKETVETLKKNKKTIVSCICVNERDRNMDNEIIYGEHNYINTCNTTPTEVSRVIKELANIIKVQYKKYIRK